MCGAEFQVRNHLSRPPSNKESGWSIICELFEALAGRRMGAGISHMPSMAAAQKVGPEGWTLIQLPHSLSLSTPREIASLWCWGQRTVGRGRQEEGTT